MKKNVYKVDKLADVPIALCQIEAEAERVGGESGEVIKTLASTMFDFLYARGNSKLAFDAENYRREIMEWLKNKAAA